MIVLATTNPNQIRVVIGRETEAAAALTGAAAVDISEILKAVGTNASLQLTFTRSEADVLEQLKGHDVSYIHTQTQSQSHGVDSGSIRARVKENTR
jgi:hypothetical protein